MSVLTEFGFSFHFTAAALRIHVSRDCHSRLVELGGYYLSERGQVQIKVRNNHVAEHRGGEGVLVRLPHPSPLLRKQIVLLITVID